VNHREDIEASELANVERIPTILISKGEESNVRYLGIPAGTEFPVLLEAIVNVSSGAPNLNEETLEFLKDLENELTIKVFVTPN
jgi:thioredoxin reductase (NADPH)